MTTIGTGFDLADLELLLDRYDTPAGGEQPRRPPWTWTALERSGWAALARMIDVYVSTTCQDSGADSIGSSKSHPGKCRRGEHLDTWRKDAQERLAIYDQLLPTDPERDERDTDLLGELHFGFPHLTDEGQR